nr:type I restriction endonuclease [Lebetimonas sp. JH292]
MVIDFKNKRADIVIFINGLPLIVMELKNPTDKNATIKSAYNQLQTYKKTIPSRKSADGKKEASHLISQLETLIYGLLNKETLIVYGLPDVKEQKEGDKKAGVVWHTQGSGKSLSMLFYAGNFNTFASASKLLRQEPVQAKSREELKKLLKVESGGVVFTTIHKFWPEEGNGNC